MKNQSGLLLRASLAVGCLVGVCPRPVPAYIEVPPPTLGMLCVLSHNIYVLKVEKASAEKGVILFKSVERLKGKPGTDDAAALKHVIGAEVYGAKVIADWATAERADKVEKTALFFNTRSTIQGSRDVGYGHVCIDNYWYSLFCDAKGECWRVTKAEPMLLTCYCGSPAKLRNAVTEILKGNEVVVPCMVKDKKEDVEQRKAKIQRLRTSIKLRDYDPKRDFVAWGVEEK